MKTRRRRSAKKKKTPALYLEEVELDARGFVTVPPDSCIWQGQNEPELRFEDMKGAIVRMFPPADLSDDAISHVVSLLEKEGAAHVRVMPRQARAAALAREEVLQVRGQTQRQVVDAMAKESRYAGADLSALVSRTMDEVGL